MQRSSIGRDGADRLERIPLFEGLSRGQRQMLARLVDEVTAEAGETVMAQGEPGFEFIVLERGRAEVRQDGARINILGPGDFSGELAVLADGSERTATIVALSDLRALVFTAHFMRELHERLPELGAQIDRTARERLERDALRRSPEDAHFE